MIYKRGGYYWYEFEFHGKRQRGTTKVPIGRGVPGEVTPKEKAKQVEAAKRMELALGSAGIKKRKPAPIFSKFVERFEKWVSAERADKPKTIEFYKDRIRQLKKFDKLANASLDDIDEQLVAQYVEWRDTKTRVYALRKKEGIELADSFKPVSVSCINRDLATLRRILNVARLWKVLPIVPIIKLLPGEAHHERVLSHAEEDAYLAMAPLMLREFATVMLDTGMRPEEICRLRWENIHLEPISGSRFGYIHNPSGKTKWAKRNLSLTARVHALLTMKHDASGKSLKGWVFTGGDPTGRVSYSTIDTQHGRTLAGLKGVPHFRLYDLRHTFLTRLGEANADPFTIQKIAGHARILVSQRYVHPTPERLEDAFAKLETYNQAKLVEMKTRAEQQPKSTIQ